MKGKHEEMQTLDSNLQVLNQFKDMKTIREETLQRESKRYEYLKRELETLKRNGKEEMEGMRKKLKEQHDVNMQDLKDKAQSDAEKNISEIERNIQAQNQRLEDEALLQEYELEYLQDKAQNF